MAVEPTFVLEPGRSLELKGERVTVRVALPASLEAGGWLRVDHSISLRDPAAPKEEFGQLRTGPRISIDLPPMFEKLRLAMQVGLVDLTPTLLDLAGVEAPTAMQGRSFATALEGDRASWSDPPRISRATTYKHVSVSTPRYKYIEQGRPKQRRFLFRPTDPEPFERGELSRIESDPELLAEAEAALAAHEAACAAFLVAHPPIADDRPRAERLPGWFVSRNEVDEMLRALGYAE
jgi:hypothetical protein